MTKKIDEFVIEVSKGELTESQFECVADDLGRLLAEIADHSFEIMFKRLNGFNLDADVTTMDGKIRCVTLRFDFNYGCLNGTIFQTTDGKCELYEGLSVWDGNYVDEIAYFEYYIED